ncbi:MAG: hypothetical protein HYZ34_09495 [Ignavibacteriae bacterium]|nr:hypothetical protein [Ignavibacteriota bacterium]
MRRLFLFVLLLSLFAPHSVLAVGLLFATDCTQQAESVAQAGTLVRAGFLSAPDCVPAVGRCHTSEDACASGKG